MDVVLAVILAIGGPAVGAVLALIGAVLIWRGRDGWRRAGWAAVVLGLTLALIGTVMYIELGQVNWGL